ncbi:hypothetical protein Pmani_020017 [Petrolisthes manimaculis]|uniref:Uncharacterized protein n=1 Tax=Petrolisthes manimaculis TaxID=1843537 RepID=A0AAE1PH54_9EUCA|nr:hypothetical protein Pmani_020017 [Petrolisthes manimaculis]
MAPTAPTSSPSPGTPHFLSRVMSLPVVRDTFTFATQYYDSSKSNDVVRSALQAAENGVRAGLTGALPLAQPLVERVGGWEAIDRWACMGLDRVQKAAPVIKLPTKELVKVTKEGVLGAVAGDKVIVPPTLTDALRTRANRMVDSLAEIKGAQAAAGVTGAVITRGHALLDTVLPKGKGDSQTEDDTDAGVVTRMVGLAWLTGHRLYRTALRTMRPDLTYQPDAAITTDMILIFARTKAVDWYQETIRESQPGERRGFLVLLVRWPLVITSNLPLSPADVNKTLDSLITQGKATPATARIAVFIEYSVNSLRSANRQVAPAFQEALERARMSGRESAARLTQIIEFGVNTSRGLVSRFSPVIGNTFQTLNPIWQEVSADTTSRIRSSLDLGRVWAAESGRKAAENGRWMAEEGRMWGQTGLSLLQLSPAIALKASEVTRAATEEWLRQRLTAAATGNGGKVPPTHLRPGVVPVRLTALVPKVAG